MSGLSEGIQIAVIIALSSTIALVVNSFLYVKDRRNQVRQQRFENYHQLVSDLVKGRKDQKGPFIDSQLAVIYELRNYREYREVTIRILEGLRERWSKNTDIDRLDIARLIKEIDYTLGDLQEE